MAVAIFSLNDMEQWLLWNDEETERKESQSAINVMEIYWILNELSIMMFRRAKVEETFSNDCDWIWKSHIIPKLISNFTLELSYVVSKSHSRQLNINASWNLRKCLRDLEILHQKNYLDTLRDKATFKHPTIK